MDRRRIILSVIVVAIVSLVVPFVLPTCRFNVTCDASAQDVDSTLPKDLLTLYQRVFHEDAGVLTREEYSTVIELAFNEATNQHQADILCDLIGISLIRTPAAERHAIGLHFARRCVEVSSDTTRFEKLRMMAVMIQVLRFDDPTDGERIETEWWGRLEKSPTNLQLTLLGTLPWVAWSGDKTKEERGQRLSKWFAGAENDDLRVAVIRSVSGAVLFHRCHPFHGLDIYKSISRTNAVSPEVMQMMFSEISDWFYTFQVEAQMGHRSQVESVRKSQVSPAGSRELAESYTSRYAARRRCHADRKRERFTIKNLIPFCLRNRA